jgi:hypothetical protein
MNYNNKIKFTFITLTLILGACGNNNIESTDSFISQSSSNIEFTQISTLSQLKSIRNNLSGNYQLINDIDLLSEEWLPMGSEALPFSGIFDGQGYTISNLNLTSSQIFVGFFSHNIGQIKNLEFENILIDVTGKIDSSITVGTLIAVNEGSIKNILVSSGIIKVKSRFGNGGSVGGVIGESNGSNLSNLINKVGIEVDKTVLGGLVGRLVGLQASSNLVESLINEGELSSNDNAIGGIIGVGSNIMFDKTINYGAIAGVSLVGGLIGRGDNVSFRDSSNNGNISGNYSIGGFIGDFTGGSNRSTVLIENSINQGNINALNNFSGGFIGEFRGNLFLSHAINRGLVTADRYAGGLIGVSFGQLAIENSINYSEITGVISGGLVGFNEGETNLNSSMNSGVVMGNGRGNGGLIGSVGGYTEINNSVNSGSIYGNGGFIGESQADTKIENSINYGSVIQENYHTAGGFLGFLSRPMSSFFSLSSLSVANISTNSEIFSIGGIIGELPSNYDHEETYYYGSLNRNGEEVTGTNFGTKVTDLSTFNLAFFTTTLEWDTEIWDFTGLDIPNGVYPTLKNMPEIPLEE